MEDCVFCNIISRTIASDILYEDEALLAIRDIMPKAPVHLLVIPKLHIASVTDLTSDHKDLVGDIIFAAQRLAAEHNIAPSGYKLVFNVGRDGGQTVPHLHLHILGGKKQAE